MIAELGLALLWMAAALACLSLVAGALFLRGGPKDLASLVRPASVAQGVLTAAAFGLLIALFVRSDMSVELVARNSHSLRLGKSRRLDAPVADDTWPVGSACRAV